jgi:SAM-dependent methyltransferase
VSDHSARPVERHCDVAVIGGSAAGLAAALALVRDHRSVIVVDAGEPRHAPSAHVHDEAGAEDLAPSPLAAVDREEVRSHGGEVLAGRVTRVTGTAEGSRVELVGGHCLVARRVLATAGLQDAAAGSRAGATVSAGLAGDDTRTADRPPSNEADWDHRYGGDQIWSGNPNGTLVKETSGVAPGRALDVGAGEGGDALWLAEHGWSVTASDISRRALDRVSAEAKRRGLRVECHHADANAVDAFGTAAFDLVSAQYAAIPRTPDDRGLRNLLGAVAPGGTLLVVSHDLEPMREPIDTQVHSRLFDPDAYVRLEDFAAALAGSSTWEVEVHEKRPRPPGSATASHHVDDVVLRARRSES